MRKSVIVFISFIVCLFMAGQALAQQQFTASRALPGVLMLLLEDDTASCTDAISPTSGSFGAGGGSQSVSVTASDSNCEWSTTNSLSWVTVSPTSGTGSQSVTVSVDANTGAARSGTVTIAGKTYSISQDDPSPGDLWTDPTTGMQFVWVPGGCYMMGCGAWLVTDSCWDDEKPVHEVCLDGFWIGKYEVTQGQWTQIMGSNPSFFKSGVNYPVERVSWDDVQGFITALNSRGSSTFRLPTEAEWEYACRSGGREEKYCGGDDLASLGWYWENSISRTHEVGTKAANGLGIYDMSGNVWEWVSDWYGATYYSVSPRDNPQGPSTGSSRVYRGGSWYYYAEHCRAANRNDPWPDYRRHDLGFRLAFSPGQQ